MVNFPTSLDVLVNPSPGTLTTDATYPHATRQHTDLNDILEALEAKLGIGVSTPATVSRLLASDAGSATSFRQLDAPDIGAQAFESLSTDNVVINGDFSVWQRGTSFAAANGATADRWLMSMGSAAVVTVSQQIPTLPGLGAGTAYSQMSCRLTVTTADAATAAGDLVILYQPIEGYLWAKLAQRPFTISFWVKATKTGAHCVAIVNAAQDRTYVGSYTINVTNTWEFKTITVLASPTSGTWAFTNTVGIYLEFVLQVGTSWHTASPDMWIFGNVRGTASIVNDMDTVGNIFEVTQVKITPGPVAAPFVPRLFQQELALCQRYFQKTFPYSIAPAQAAGAGGALVYYAPMTGAGHYVKMYWRFPVVMRATPTIVTYNPAVANAEWRDLSLGADDTMGAIDASDRGLMISAAQGAGSAATHQHAIHAIASAEL